MRPSKLSTLDTQDKVLWLLPTTKYFCRWQKHETHKSNIIKHFHVLVKTTNHRLVQDCTWIILVLFMMHFLYTRVWISLLLKVYLLTCWNLTKLQFILVNEVWRILFYVFDRKSFFFSLNNNNKKSALLSASVYMLLFMSRASYYLDLKN